MKKKGSEELYIYGKNPVSEAVKNELRVKRLMIEQRQLDGKYNELIKIARSKNIHIDTVSEQSIAKKLGRGIKHQGVMAVLEEFKYSELEDILKKGKKNKPQCIVITDHVQDPQNLGVIIRNAAAFGADAVLIPRANQVGITSGVVKASAGIVFSVPIVRIANVRDTMEKMKREKFWIIGLDGDGDKELAKLDLSGNIVFIAGAEGAGISKLVCEHCDFVAHIPIAKEVESLNVASSTAIAMYEWRKQNS